MPKIKIKNIGKPGVTPVHKRSTTQQTTGFGYIMIPEGVDRDQFVETCYRKCRVTIIDDGSGNIIHDCYITNEALQNVKFPRVVGEKGIPVVWVAQPFQTEPMVIGTFLPQERIEVRDDEEFIIKREWDKGLLTISGSAKDGSLFISVRGQESGYMKVNVSGDENSAIEVTSSGSVKVEGNGNIDVTAFKNLTAQVIDPDTENRSGISINKDAFVIEAIYGEEDENNSVNTTITTEGMKSDIVFSSGEEFHEEITALGVKSSQKFEKATVNSEITEGHIQTIADFDGSKYENTIDKAKALIQFMDSSVQLEEKKATVKQDDAYIEINNGKMSFINNSTGMNELMTKIVDAVKTLTVSTAVGPSGTPLPPTIQKTTELEQLLKKFFNS
jgi:hypothetical protein|nr:MAG TPA: hypothetical protein [Herelleviridae sp.]